MRKIIENQSETQKKNENSKSEQLTVKAKNPKNLATTVKDKSSNTTEGADNETA